MGEPLVVAGAMLACSFGATPSSLMVVPSGVPVTAGGPQAATIMDHKPMLNIATFGVCSSIANPTVAAATSAAMGVLTPMPCIPMTTTPWTPGSPKTTIGGQPALTQSSQCICQWAGVITISNPGQVKVTG